MSSSRKAPATDPLAILALVPVTKNPTTGTRMIAPTTPAVPVTPLSSNVPDSLTCLPPTVAYKTLAVMCPDLPHIPLLRTSVISPCTGDPDGMTIFPFNIRVSAISIRKRCPTRATLRSVVSSSSKRTDTLVPARRILSLGGAIAATVGSAAKEAVAGYDVVFD